MEGSELPRRDPGKEGADALLMGADAKEVAFGQSLHTDAGWRNT